MEENNEISAKNKIKTLDLYSNTEYEQLHPIMEDVLEDRNPQQNIEAIVHTIIGEDILIVNKEAIDNDKNDIQSEEKEYTLTSITKISNLGLLDVKPEEKIEFDPKLTIIYGKNGSGKSTLYKALCNLFGYPKKCTKKLSSDNDHGSITAIVQNGEEEKVIDWDFTKENTSSNKVKIFDSRISQSIVLRDQDNKFELSHLGVEYFVKLYASIENFIDILHTSWQAKSKNIDIMKEKIEKYRETFEKLPSIEEVTKNFQEFSEKDKETITEINALIVDLKSSDIEKVTQRYITLREKTNDIFEIYDDKIDVSLSPRFNTAKLREINELITRFHKESFALKKSSLLDRNLIPSDWLKNPVWESFIKYSIDFTKMLDEQNQRKYTREECIYCHQKLIDEKSKELIDSYKQLTDNLEDNLKETRVQISSERDFLVKQMVAIDYFKTQFSELLSQDDQTYILQSFDIYEDVIKKIDSLNSIKFKSGEWDKLGNVYSKLCDIFNKTYWEYIRKSQQLSKKQETILKLDSQVKELERKRMLTNFQKDFQQYYELTNLKGKIISIENLATRLKTAISNERRLFEKSSTQTQFNKFLQEEYEKLDFKPPKEFSLKFNVSEAESKRRYIVSDQDLLDIFSEGEQKLHSLADFFAESKAQGFNGIYIFDDPVNSLDEGNIKRIATRILELKEEGNQVIVFTHNMILLNELVDVGTAKFGELEKFRGVVYYTFYNQGGAQRFESRGKQIEKLIGTLDTLPLSVEQKEGVSNGYDLISGYLEMFLEERLLKNIVNRYRRNIAMQKLPAIAGDIKPEQFRKLYTLYDITSCKGNRHASVQNNKEYEGNIDTLKEDWKQVKNFIESCK